MLRLAPVLLLAACSTTDVDPDPTARRRPNIVFILADDHSTGALGAYGVAHAPTPNLDQLARQGLVFDRAYAANSICCPSRAAILTGTYGHVNGVDDNGDRFDGSQPTFPKALRAAGYRTAIVGKWHLKSDPTGFDHWEVLPGQGHYYAPDLKGPDGVVRHEGYVTDVLTDRALEWLQANCEGDQPFLLYLGHKAPHRRWMPGPEDHALFADRDLPEPATLFDDGAGRSAAFGAQTMSIARDLWMHYDLKVDPGPDAPEPTGPDRWAEGIDGRMASGERAAWEAAYGPRNEAFAQAHLEGDALVRWKFQRYLKDYLRCIAGIDRSVGRVLAELERLGLADDTLVVYTSDQGFFLGEHGWYDKRWLYEPSLRFPLIVRWPGVVEPGRRDAHLAMNIDFAPTLCEVAGAHVPERVQGASLLPLLRGEEPQGWREAIYAQYFEVGIHDVEPQHGLRTDRYKLIRFPRLDAWELYDLERDPDELHNLAGDPGHAAIRARLEEMLTELRAAYGAP